MIDLSGKRALVTGAASGIGAASAAALARAGAAVTVTDRDATGAEATAEAIAGAINRGISGAGGQAAAFALDVTDEGAWRRVLKAMAAAGGPPDILVNNAGVVSQPRPLEAIPLDEWRAVCAVNIDGVFLGVKHGIRAMKARGGAIVNVASIFGHVGAPFIGAYGAAKHAVRAITRIAALECAQSGYPIRVNAVCPGYIDTAITDQVAEWTDNEAIRDVFAGYTPMGRMGRPEEIANAVVYLASDESSFMTGADLAVDGGYLAQ